MMKDGMQEVIAMEGDVCDRIVLIILCGDL